MSLLVAVDNAVAAVRGQVDDYTRRLRYGATIGPAELNLLLIGVPRIPDRCASGASIATARALVISALSWPLASSSSFMPRSSHASALSNIASRVSSVCAGLLRKWRFSVATSTPSVVRNLALTFARTNSCQDFIKAPVERCANRRGTSVPLLRGEEFVCRSVYRCRFLHFKKYFVERFLRGTNPLINALIGGGRGAQEVVRDRFPSTGAVLGFPLQYRLRLGICAIGAVRLRRNLMRQHPRD